MGLVRIEKLKKNRGYVLIGIFILAALLTPPDAISQCSLADADVPALRGRHPHGAHPVAQPQRRTAAAKAGEG